MAHDGLAPKIRAIEPSARTFPALVISLIPSVVRFAPDGLHEGGEALVEPDVAPVLAGDQIAEPLVPELVRDQGVLAGGVFGSQLGMNERSAAVGGGAGVFHAARDEIIHHDLRVFFPGIIDAQLLAEEIHHRGRAAIVDGEAVSSALRRIVGDGDAAPGVLQFVEFAGHNGDEIRGTGDGFLPIPGLQPFAGVGDANELAVRNGDPGGRNREDRFCGEAIVRIVVGGQVVACVFGFALRPNLFRAVRIVFVRQDEIHSFAGFAFVTDGGVEFVTGLRGCGKRNDEFVRGGFKFRRGFVQRNALDGQAGGVESDFCGAVAKNGKRVRDVAENLFVFEVKTQRDFRMLQIIVAAARVRFIGAGLQGGDENRREHCEGTKRGPTSPAIAVAKRFPDHSVALLFTVCPARSRAATAANRASEATSR